jgi:hypothetical protein
MSVVYRRSASIVPDMPSGSAERPYDFRDALSSRAQRVVPSWTQLYPCPYLEPHTDFRPQGDGATRRSLCIAMIVFAVAAGLSAWLIGA